MAMAILELDNVTIRFGGLVAVSSVNLTVEQGSIQALIGPNGAGKSTLFNLITSIYRPTEGTISFKGRTIGGMPTFRIAAAGTIQRHHREFGDRLIQTGVRYRSGVAERDSNC